jgi:SAM-dependent methyltransferase
MKKILNQYIFKNPINSYYELPIKVIHKIQSIFRLQYPATGFARYHVSKFIIDSAKQYNNNYYKLLDVGAGHQPYKKYFDKCIYESCDNKEVIEEVKYNIGDIEHTFYSDINKNIPQPDNSYDIILCSEVLEHVYNPSNTIKEINRVLKKDGILILTAPQCAGEHQLPHHYFNFSINGLRYLLENNNFKITSLRASCGIFHLAAHILNKIINKLFLNNNLIFKIIFLPLELTFRILNLLISILFYHIDFLDKEKNWTTDYLCIAKKI